MFRSARNLVHISFLLYVHSERDRHAFFSVAHVIWILIFDPFYAGENARKKCASRVEARARNEEEKKRDDD